MPYKHRYTYKGRLVRVRLRYSADIIIDHFEEFHSRWIKLRKYGRIKKCDIESLTIHTHQSRRLHGKPVTVHP